MNAKPTQTLREALARFFLRCALRNLAYARKLTSSGFTNDLACNARIQTEQAILFTHQ